MNTNRIPVIVTCNEIFLRFASLLSDMLAFHRLHGMNNFINLHSAYKAFPTYKNVTVSLTILVDLLLTEDKSELTKVEAIILNDHSAVAAPN